MLEILPDTGGPLTPAQVEFVRPGTRVRWHDRRIHFGHVIDNGRRDQYLHVIEEAGGEKAIDPATTSIFVLGRSG